MTTAMKQRQRKLGPDGTYIEIYDTGYDGPEYVMGHVTQDEFLTIVARAGVSTYRLKLVRFEHRYGRTSLCRCGDHDWDLETYNEPGRGRFKITMGWFE